MGMELVTLTKPWLEHAIGDTVEVDPLRARWLRDNSYGESAPRPHPEFPGLTVEPDTRVSRELEVRPYIGNPAPTQEMIDDVRPFVELAEAHMRETLNEVDPLPVSEDLD